MRGALGRALRLSFQPAAEWQAIARESPRPQALLSSFVLPLACLPAAGWALNRMLFAGSDSRGAASAPADAVQAVYGAAVVYACVLLSIALLGLALFVLAPLFDRPRDWTRSFLVAACSSGPMLLAGTLLVVPDLAYLLPLAAFQSAYLLYGGLQRVLGVREDRAAEYVALGLVLMIAASTLLGGVGGALGVL